MRALQIENGTLSLGGVVSCPEYAFQSFSFQSLSRLGLIALESTIHAERGVDSTPLVIKEVHLVGSRSGPIDRVVELLARVKLDPLPLISETNP